MRVILYPLLGVLLAQITQIYFPHASWLARASIFLLMSLIVVSSIHGISHWMGGRARD